MNLQVRDVAAPRGTAVLSVSRGRGFYCERAEHRKLLSAQKEQFILDGYKADNTIIKGCRGNELRG